jgi:hypothetical protein
MRWVRIPDTGEEATSLMLSDRWEYESMTWRTAGAVVAHLRNIVDSKLDEDYLNWYCNGNEGTVSPRIKETMKELGWMPIPWPNE